MTEEIIIDKEDKTKKHRNNEINCLHFSCRKGESGKVLLWCGFYDDYCDNHTGCYYRKYLRLEQERDELKFENDRYKQLLKGCPTEDEDCGLCVIDEQNKRLKQENERLKDKADHFEMANDIKKQEIDSLREYLARLEQENKDLKKQIESDKGLITVGGKQQYDMTIAYDKCKTALEEIKKIAKDIIENDVYENSDAKAEKILNKIDEVLNKG